MSKSKSKPGNHGGARAGAGRKPMHAEAKITRSVAITRDVHTFLGSVGSASEWIDQLVRRSAAFRRWTEKEAEK